MVETVSLVADTEPLRYGGDSDLPSNLLTPPPLRQPLHRRGLRHVPAGYNVLILEAALVLDRIDELLPLQRLLGNR